ncbi:MAG: hypothetical protein KDB00_09265 [Planctomycetales bacterium]|nr:hypothetical protein [Planctomycetales bacterium]
MKKTKNTNGLFSWNQSWLFSATVLILLCVLDTTIAVSEDSFLEVELTKKGPFESVGLLEIRSLDVGEENTIQIKLINRTGTVVRLDDPETTCGCVSVKSDVATLRDGNFCVLEVKLKPERDYTGKIWSQTIAFESRTKEKGVFSAATINVRANLQGVFVAKPERLVFAATSGTMKGEKISAVEQTVNLHITHPIQLENIKVHGSPVLNLFDVVKIPDPEGSGGGVVKMSIAPDDIPESGLHGLLILSHEKSGQSRRIPFSAVKRQPVRAVPSTIVVQRTESSDYWAAYGLLVNQRKEGEELGNNDDVIVEASIGSVKVPVVVESKGNRIKRLKIILKQEVLEKAFASSSGQQCTFNVLWGETRTSCECKILFLDQFPTEEVQR